MAACPQGMHLNLEFIPQKLVHQTGDGQPGRGKALVQLNALSSATASQRPEEVCPLSMSSSFTTWM